MGDLAHARSDAQQVIIQVWISTHFGVLSEQLPVPDENILFIRGIVTRSRVCVKGNRAFFGLLASRGLPQAGADQPGTGRYLAIGVAMEQVSRETWVAFEGRLERAGVPAPQRPEYHRWVRFFFDFCAKYGHSPALPTSLGPFLAKLTAKNQSVDQRSQAAG